MEFETEDHYARLAVHYNGNWAHRRDYVAWMSERLRSLLDVRSGERVVDIGAGTGLFLRALGEVVSASNPLVCVDPSRPMLDQLPQDARLSPLQATAEQVASGEVGLPYRQIDAVLMKEVIHHVSDIASTVRGLTHLLADGGRFLVVSLPPLLQYPLFDAALDRFAEHQPEPATIADHMAEAGLQVQVSYDGFAVRVQRDQYMELVRRRWMSVLSTFPDDELAAGVDEIRRLHQQPTLEFVDRFAFVLGVKDPASGAPSAR